jgi:hypothetical protein
VLSLISVPLLLFAFAHQPVITDHLANGLLGFRLSLFVQSAHVLAPLFSNQTRELADVSCWTPPSPKGDQFLMLNPSYNF